MITVKRQSKIPQLIKKLANINKEEAQIGYFRESGDHPTAEMSYAELAFVHAHGNLFGFPIRNVFSPIKPKIGGEPYQKRFLSKLISNYLEISSNQKADNLLDLIGNRYKTKGQAIFGSTYYLIVTGSPTPLIDQGDLKENFGFRTTLNKNIRL